MFDWLTNWKIKGVNIFQIVTEYSYPFQLDHIVPVRADICGEGKEENLSIYNLLTF